MKEEILPGIEAIGLGLWIKKDKTLVIADLHLGIEEMFNKQGTMLPRFNFNKIKKHLEEKIFPNVKPEKIVINGDLKHEFGSISEQEWSETIDMLRLLGKKCKKIVLVRGNHDTVLGPIAKWEKLEIKKEGTLLKKSNTFVTHGEEIPKSEEFKKAKTIIISHEHPAITIREKYKEETFKAFLIGKYREKNLVVQPSMNQVTTGTNAKEERFLSPFLQQDTGEFEAYATADKAYYFGHLNELE